MGYREIAELEIYQRPQGTRTQPGPISRCCGRNFAL